ncbi:glycosyltransferase, partial [Arthrobacter sp. JCM 19049]|uniref:glycosyltransferase n=1 Tax=Arthrobacter sp. JCM 19049 TaxID=1460643 RepID=UPI000AAB41C7
MALARFLLAATPFAGHVVPMLALAGTLVGRGHQVRFYTGEKYAHLALEVGCDHVHAPGPRFRRRRPGSDFPEGQRGRSLSSLLASVRQVFFSNGPGQARDLIAAHRSVPVEALIGENMCFGTGLAHEMTGVPGPRSPCPPCPFPP